MVFFHCTLKPKVSIVSFYVLTWFTGGDMKQVTMLKFMSNIKDKYDPVHAISNLGILAMFVFLL